MDSYKQGAGRGWRRGQGRSGPLQDEGQDGGAERGVVAELLQVTAVLPFGPHGHLDETHQGEEGHRQTLGHQREAEPGAELRRGAVILINNYTYQEST